MNVDDAHLQLLVLYLSGLSSNPQGSATTASQGVHPAAGSSFANPASGVPATSVCDCSGAAASAESRGSAR